MRLVSQPREDVRGGIPETAVVDAMDCCANQVSCHHYAGLRPTRTAVTTDSLSARARRATDSISSPCPTRDPKKKGRVASAVKGDGGNRSAPSSIAVSGQPEAGERGVKLRR